MIYIVDEIEKVVIAMRSDPKIIALFNNPNINGLYPFFKPGHLLEVVTSLTEKDKDPVYMNQKYPLIALRMDIAEQHTGTLVNFKLNLAIVYYTEPNLIVEDRYNATFKPILYPLYESFMRNLKSVGLFYWKTGSNNELPPHEKYDRPFYGTEGKNSNEKYIFNDPLDAIEIVNLEISKRNKGC